jgi:hypothetical protein
MLTRAWVSHSKEVLSMIEMKCPACGAEGRAPKEKVNTRLICRKCLKVFHLTTTGRAVPGDPPVTGYTSAATPEDLAAADQTRNVDEWFERLSKAIMSRRMLYGALTVVLLLLVLSYVLSPRADTLQERVTKVALAALSGDVQSISALASTGTKEDASQWYETIRTQCNELRALLGSRKPQVTVDVKVESADSDSVDVVARLDAEQSLERRGGTLPDPSLSLTVPVSSQTLSLPMTWRSEGWSGWRLDGRRTLLGSLAGLPEPSRTAENLPKGGVP